MRVVMGSLMFKPAKDRNIKILVQGLQGAGKRTIMHKFNFDRGTTLILRGDGNYIRRMEYRKIVFLVYDVTYGSSEGDPYADTYPDTDALIYVVDSHDRSTLDEARDVLHQILQHELLKGIPLLVMSNKSDLENPLHHFEMIERLQLHKVSQDCSVFSTSGDDGSGLYEALDWLSDALSQKQKTESYLETVKQLGQKSWEQVTSYFR